MKYYPSITTCYIEERKVGYIATLRPIILKKLPEHVIKEIILYGERRLHAKSGGHHSAMLRQAKNQDRDKTIIQRYQMLCEANCKSGAASIIAKSHNLTPTQVLNIVIVFQINNFQAT